MRSNNLSCTITGSFQPFLAMRIQIKPIFKLLKEAFSEWQEDKVSLLAAALAYYTVFSITPLLVIAIRNCWFCFWSRCCSR